MQTQARPAKATLAEIASSIKAQGERQAAARRAEDRKVFGDILDMAAGLKALVPASRPAPVGSTAPIYITGTPARVAQRNRDALQSMVARTLADGRREIITAAIARIEANRAAHERGCTPAHCRGLNLFDYVEALAALREAA